MTTDTFYRDATAMINFHRLARGLRAMKFDFPIVGGEYEKKPGDRIIAPDVPLDEANLLTSCITERGRWDQDRHKIVLDIDYDAALIPSSTPGHHHLVLDRVIGWDRYKVLLKVLAQADVIQRGYAEASIAKGYTAIRTPWEKK